MDWRLSTAHAHEGHDGPGHWWRIGVDGEGLEQVTAESTIHYDGAGDPTGQGFVSASREGLLGYDSDGGPPVILVKDRAVRALTWGRARFEFLD